MLYEGEIDLREDLQAIREGKGVQRSIFENKNHVLPEKPYGYYQEYYRKTPGFVGTGPERIIVGQEGDIYYTPDHYTKEFYRLTEPYELLAPPKPSGQ